MRSGDDDLIHRDLEQGTQRIEVIYTGQALPPLPFVDGLWLLESEILLEISNRQTTVFSKSVATGSITGNRITDIWIASIQ